MGRLLPNHFYVIHTFINSINDSMISIYSEKYLTLHVLYDANGRSSGAVTMAFAEEAKSGTTSVSKLQNRSERPGTRDRQRDPLRGLRYNPR
jgi:hypothetical protein